MTCQPKASTLEHQLWRLMDLVEAKQAYTFYSWDRWCDDPSHPEVGGDDAGYESWIRARVIPYYLLLTGALPGESGVLS